MKTKTFLFLRLAEDVIKDKGLCCRFVIANVPRDAPITERAIPLAIFQSEQSIRNHYLRSIILIFVKFSIGIIISIVLIVVFKK